LARELDLETFTEMIAAIETRLAAGEVEAVRGLLTNAPDRQPRLDRKLCGSHPSPRPDTCGHGRLTTSEPDANR